MQKITLGLDIGQYSIKGIRPKTRGTPSTRSFEKRLPRDQGSDPFTLLSDLQQAALKEFVAEGEIRASDAIAVALPGHLLSTREITLPFTDTQKIRKTVYYEAEHLLPFNVEEAILDYHILARASASTRVLVFAAPKAMLKDYLEKLSAVGIDPVIVSVDQIALYYARRLPVKGSEKSNLVVDLGATKTVLCHIHQGEFDWARTTPLGTDFFVDLVKDEHRLSWTEAEQHITQLDQPDRIEDCERLVQQISSWVNDMEVSLVKVESSSPLYLFGGAPKGVGHLLSKGLHREVIMQNHPPGGEALVSSPSFVQATGLTLLPVHAINFRKGEFTHKKEKIEHRRFVPLGIFILLLFCLTGVNFFLHTLQKEETLRALKDQLRTTFVSLFPDVKNVVDEVKQADVAIEGLRKQSDFLGIGMNTPLLILEQIAEAIPPGVKMYIAECDIEQRNVQISAQTTSFNAVDQIRSALTRVDRFENVAVSDTHVAEDMTRIRFRIHMTLKTPKALFQSRL